MTRREWLALGALVLVSTVLRTWASRGVPTPWITPDETLYGLLGQGLWRDGKLAVLGGPTPYYSLVVPLVSGLPLSLGDLALGYSLLKALQALVMSLAAVPVYVWGRSLTAPRWALLAAVLTVALPGLAYSGLVMTEAVFYPVFVLAAWAAAEALARPTLRRQALLVAATLLALATRLQAVVLLPAFVTSVGIEWVLARRAHVRGVRRKAFAPTLVAAAVVAVAWIVWRLAARSGLLAGYGGAGGSYDAGHALRFVAYHAGDLALLCGLLPLAALLLLLAGREADPRVRAFLAVTTATTLWLVVEVGVFASRELGLLAERNVIAAAPLLFLAFAVWLGRGAPGTYPGRVAVGIAIGALILALPLHSLVVPDAFPHAFTLIPIYQLLVPASVDTLRLALAVVVAVAFVLLVVRRAVVAAPIAVLAALAVVSVSASREVVDQARAQQVRLLGPERRWIDAAADGPVAYVYDGQAWWNAAWENVFWNRDVRWVYDLPATRVPGDLPQELVDVRPDGELRPGGERSPARYGVVPLHIALRGERVAEAPQVGTDRAGLGLWRLDPPLRLSTITSGLFENGDVDREAALTVYDCRAGAFDAILLVKEPQTIRVLLDGRRVRTQRFDRPTTWHVGVPVPAARAPRVCKLRIVPGALLGSTRLAFDRG